MRKFESGNPETNMGLRSEPCSLAVDAADNWLLCAREQNNVQIFTSEGNFLTSFGGRTYVTDFDGDEDRPVAACVDQDHRICVAYANGRIRFFCFTTD